MSIPLKFIYYLLERITNISNQIKTISDNQNNNSEKILNEIIILKNNMDFLKSQNEILKNEKSLYIDGLEILKNDYIKFKNDIIESSNSDNIILQDKNIQPRIYYDKYNCTNYLDKRLADFLKVDLSTKLCHQEIMKRIYKYISDNNLRNVVDIKIISPDLALKKLLKIENKEVILTYANIQYYIQPMLKPIIINKSLNV